MSPNRHKITSAFIVAIVTFLGFESLSLLAGIYEIQTYVLVAFYVAIFHLFWITFVFDLHLKHSEPVDLSSAHYRRLLSQAVYLRLKHFFNWHYVKHYLNYLILPDILFWSVVVLIFLNPFRPVLKELVIVSGSFALTVAYWYMKEHLTRKLEAHSGWLKILAGVKIFAAFLSYSGLFGLVWYFGLSQNFLFYAVVITTFFLVYQALYSYGFHSAGLLTFTLLCSVIIGFVGIWIYKVWSVEYFTAALVLLALYNTLWGFIHHYLDKTLSIKVIIEYLMIAVVVLSMVFGSHNFGTRII